MRSRLERAVKLTVYLSLPTTNCDQLVCSERTLGTSCNLGTSIPGISSLQTPTTSDNIDVEISDNRTFLESNFRLYSLGNLNNYNKPPGLPLGWNNWSSWLVQWSRSSTTSCNLLTWRCIRAGSYPQMWQRDAIKRNWYQHPIKSLNFYTVKCIVKKRFYEYEFWKSGPQFFLSLKVSKNIKILMMVVRVLTMSEKGIQIWLCRVLMKLAEFVISFVKICRKLTFIFHF